MSNVSLVPMCESSSAFDSLHPQRFSVGLSGTAKLAKSRSSVKRKNFTGMGERTFCMVPRVYKLKSIVKLYAWPLGPPGGVP